MAVLRVLFLAFGISCLLQGSTGYCAPIVTVSRTTSQNHTGDSYSVTPFLSENGRYLVFSSASTNMTSPSPQQGTHVFLYDALTQALSQETVQLSPMIKFPVGHAPSVSEDGRYIAYVSPSKLLDSDNNVLNDVYYRNRVSGVTQLVSVSSTEAQSNGDSAYASISSTGRYVVFTSTAENLVSSTYPDDVRTQI